MIGSSMSVYGQAAPSAPVQATVPSPAPQPLTPQQDDGHLSLLAWSGLRVSSIQFQGVSEQVLAPLPDQLEQQRGEALDPVKVRDDLRRLYQTGLYQTIQVVGVRSGESVALIFSGVPRLFWGRLDVNGIKDDRLTSLIESSTQFQAGTPYSPLKAAQAETAVKQALKNNGYYRSQVAGITVIDRPNSLIDLSYEIAEGKPARIGKVTVTGESGLTEQQFRRQTKLKQGSKVNRNTVNRALSRLRNHYEGDGHVTATATLTSKQYVPPLDHLNYGFLAHMGPLVTVIVQGAPIGKGLLKKLVPVYEEGALDQDLLNEGTQNLRNYYQSRGYFDVQVALQPVHTDAQHITAAYTVKLGQIHVIDSVAITGNRYFSNSVIDQRISVRPANLVERHGIYSPQLVSHDIGAIQALYQSNGFSNVKVTVQTTDVGSPKRNATGPARLRIRYVIDEDTQQHVGKYEITGATAAQIAQFQPYLNTQPGQPYSSVNISGDRDLVQNYYLSHGYENTQINLFQETEPSDPGLVDVTMQISEGAQFFVRKLIISGIHYTRPSVVQSRISLRPGDPLDQTALLETQRKLYDLALFNEVNTAIENPSGDETYKNVLLNLTEAKRWDLNYGFGFEAQTGTPTQGCLSTAVQILLGIANSYKCTPNGQFGTSPRVLFNISRTNLRGTDQSITLRTNYGTLEQLAILTYQDPHVFRTPNLNLTLSGGYDNSANISTYRAAVLSGVLRLSERVDKANTVIYSFSYRRVSVNSNTLQVSLADIPLLAEPVRVGGPGVTWIRDTRDTPLDAHHGSLTSAEQFLAQGHFGSQASFDRLDVSNATYYSFGRTQHWVFARQTRYGQERAFGSGDEELIPLPERLYAGGATSLRGFPQNSAGPRDPQTGYPIGGAGAFVNTFEIRTPAPDLPYVGTNISFVLFHDMGNVFENSSQIWSSFLRTKQPHSYTCRNVSTPYTTYNTPDTCDFNDFSHALGLGLRYHTPIGPLRGDIAYNLNPPIYPVIYDYTTTSSTPDPHVGQASHFNFFFSIGQSF